MGDHLVGGGKRSKRTASFNIGKAFRELGIDDAALGRRVLVVGIREFGTVHHRLRREHNFPALKGGLNEVSFHKVGFAPDAVRDGHLAFVLNLNEGRQ